MQNVLADLALESEAATVLTMRIARAMDHKENPHESNLARLVTAVGKYWICKRSAQHAYEAMECIGGSGVMEDSPMPRLYREAPVNAIWEGSGNIQCLDVLRILNKSPAVLSAFFDEVDRAKERSASLDKHIAALKTDLHDGSEIEYRSRDLVDRIAVGLQAALLLQHAPDFVSHAFCKSRLDSAGQHQYGALPRGVAVKEIIARSMPIA
jgi:putative acyl-CoA dehydrogenase